MKYFTKAWYELCQKTSYHLSLEEDGQAGTFSEEYFQQVYNNELNKWLTLQEEVNALMRAENYSNEPFNRDEAIEQFHNGFIHNKEVLQKELPESILQQIADIRVFALHKATRDVINAVTQFCEANKKAVKAASENYRKYIEEAEKVLDKEIVEIFSFHDCMVINSVKSDHSLKLYLDNSGGFTNINEVIFENFHIIQQDGPLEDSWWLYEEVYKVDDKYEFHVLLQHRTMGLIDFIISAERIYFGKAPGG